ncbi:hypothetical protein Rsub_10823 [Raphidocelis subcapitata]|uniref:DUF1990 domain-containing protein n=1 Tax=Raphidocelis subcapitata TaxID=307507 RepID=A0A2V0PFK6_9CHLO|nr:hypothetical protein Rsub_10823 [Raphidocelis subcapitata]|eukprot:GBF98634.1 hypothetical protein Rsub_10823 [Raphidocelis subcapitata]
MFFVSLSKPSREQEAAVCRKGQSGGFNYGCPGASQRAPPLPESVDREGWWAVDHQRIKIGYGRKTYAATKDLLSSWGQFQLPWAAVAADTPLEAGGPVCVAANVFGLWTAVPLQLLYKQEGNWREGAAAGGGRGGKRRHGRAFSYACGCLSTHYLAGEERFKVEWDKTDDSVWYDILTYSRPAHPLAFLGYPVVRALQGRFRSDSARSVARAAALGAVERSMDAKTRARLAAAESLED